MYFIENIKINNKIVKNIINKVKMEIIHFIDDVVSIHHCEEKKKTLKR